MNVWCYKMCVWTKYILEYVWKHIGKLRDCIMLQDVWQLWQWFWHSWQSTGCFWHDRFEVWIQQFTIFTANCMKKKKLKQKMPGIAHSTMWHLSDDVAFQTYPSYQSLPLAPKTPRVLFIKQTTFNVFDICQCFQLYKWSYLRSVWPEKIAECL